MKFTHPLRWLAHNSKYKLNRNNLFFKIWCEKQNIISAVLLHSRATQRGQGEYLLLSFLHVGTTVSHIRVNSNAWSTLAKPTLLSSAYLRLAFPNCCFTSLPWVAFPASCDQVGKSCHCFVFFKVSFQQASLYDHHLQKSIQKLVESWYKQKTR